MDAQHSILLDTLNELRLIMVSGSSHERVAETFDRFIEFTRMHFRSEEQLLEQEHYPELAEHRAEHHKILAGMLQKARLVQTGEASHTHSLLNELRSGLLDHIELFDNQYGLFLNDRGIL